MSSAEIGKAAYVNLTKETFPGQIHKELVNHSNVSASVTLLTFPLLPLHVHAHTVLYKTQIDPQSTAQYSYIKECYVYMLTAITKKRCLVVSTVPVHKTVIVREMRRTQN